MKKTDEKATQKVAQRLTIGDVARKLNIKPFVVRFWEREFNLKPRRAANGQRFYTTKEFEKISLIKQLLHHDGFTIAGAKKHISELHAHTPSKLSITAAVRVEKTGRSTPNTHLYTQLIQCKEQLIQLKRLLFHPVHKVDL